MYGTKPGDCYYWKNDKFMYFTFDGIHSSKYHLFIVNNNSLGIENTVGAQSSFSNAFMQDGTYYLGTSTTQKTFKRSVASEGLTYDDYKNMMLWLAPGTLGELVFDTNSDWGWNVVVDTVGDAKFTGDTDFMIVEFDITFKTVGTHKAHNVHPCIWETFDYSGDVTEDDIIQSVASSNSYRIPAIYAKMIDSDQTIVFNLQNISNISQKFKFYTGVNISEETATKITISQKNLQAVDDIVFDEVDIKLEDNKFLEYDSESGIMIIDHDLVEQQSGFISEQQINGLIKIKSTTPKLFTGIQLENTEEPNQYKIQFNKEQDYDNFIQGEFDYIALVKYVRADVVYGSPFNISGDTNVYIPDNESYIYFSDTFQLDDNIFNISNNTLYFQDLTHSLDIDDNYILYAGYSTQFKITASNNTFDSQNTNIKLISYNNM